MGYLKLHQNFGGPALEPGPTVQPRPDIVGQFIPSGHNQISLNLLAPCLDEKSEAVNITSNTGTYFKY